MMSYGNFVWIKFVGGTDASDGTALGFSLPD